MTTCWPGMKGTTRSMAISVQDQLDGGEGDDHALWRAGR